MVINGINPGTPIPEKKPEAEHKVEAQPVLKEEVRKEIVKQEEQKEANREKYDPEKFKLDDYSLKELLFLMTSRGNTETIEKLAMILKREKEEMNAKKRS